MSPTSGRDVFVPDLLAGRRAVVTGGSSGIGWETARALLRHGAEVAIVARQTQRLEDAAERLWESTGRAVSTVSCDVRDQRAVTAMAQRVGRELGPVDILVNNAAANFRMPAERMTPRAFGTVLDIDLLGTFQVTRALIEPMLERGEGTIVSIAVPEPQRGFPNCSHAGAAKAGIISLTASWAREWGPRGVRANAVAPGPVPTEAVTSQVFSEPGVLEKVRESVPLGRLGEPSDIADAVLFLCSEAGRWITGTTLVVDGGSTTNRI